MYGLVKASPFLFLITLKYINRCIPPTNAHSWIVEKGEGRKRNVLSLIEVTVIRLEVVG